MRKNIVLIGMPGCGKSAVGRELSAMLHMVLMDTDRMVEQADGRTIPEIFAQEGEGVFRDRETAAAKQAASMTGVIIATGGGAVTREENYAPLHQNGTIVHLTRPIDLLPTEGRPISQGTDRVLLWQQRKVLYEHFGDFTMANTATPEETAERIKKELSIS